MRALTRSDEAKRIHGNMFKSQTLFHDLRFESVHVAVAHCFASGKYLPVTGSHHKKSGSDTGKIMEHRGQPRVRGSIATHLHTPPRLMRLLFDCWFHLSTEFMLIDCSGCGLWTDEAKMQDPCRKRMTMMKKTGGCGKLQALL